MGVTDRPRPGSRRKRASDAAKPARPQRAPVRAAQAEPAGQPARREALRLLAGVLGEGRMLSDLAERMSADLAPEDRARAGTLAAETLRRLGQADDLIRRFARKAPPLDARNALRVAAVEMHALGVRPHAAVDGAVAAVKSRPGGERLTGLVNAVARKLSSEGGGPWVAQDAAKLNAPGWLWGRLSSAYGGAGARRIAEAHLRAAPIDLTLRDPADAGGWAERLEAERLPGGSLRLRRRAQISALPGFEEGAWWVQDAAAAIPARALGPVRGARVLDLCAAPGGKTLQLAAAGGRVTALDISARRMERLAANLARTGLAAERIAADAFAWEPGAPFDAILLDAPCSATGTIRRHPDLPHRRDGIDLSALTAQQDALLDRAWAWLRPGGRLVYATCSLLPEEGEHRADAFRARAPGLRPIRLDPAAFGGPAFWATEDGDLRLRPDFQPDSPAQDAGIADFGGMDGFFVAAFLKES